MEYTQLKHEGPIVFGDKTLIEKIKKHVRQCEQFQRIIECKECEGTGEIECEECYGEGSHPCERCR